MKNKAMKNIIKSSSKTLCFIDKVSYFSSILCFVEAELSVLQQEANHFLHHQELSFLEEFPSEKRQHSFLLGRYAAKQALTQHNTAISPTDILIKPGYFSATYSLSPWRGEGPNNFKPL